MDRARKELLDRVLSLDALNLPPEAPIEHLQWEEYTDWVGQDAVMVTVVLADGLAEGERYLDYLVPIQQRIFDAIRQAGIEEPPYARMMLACDWREEQQAA